jgi:hypothetical protein
MIVIFFIDSGSGVDPSICLIDHVHTNLIFPVLAGFAAADL